MRFEFNKWLLRKSKFHNQFNRGRPIPLKVMFGKIVKETDRCYYIEVYGKPEPTEKCLHCGRKLTHKVSMYYGLGPICGKHYNITNVTEENIDSKLDEIRKHLKEVTWRGLVPKDAVQFNLENFYVIGFEYNGKTYRVKTDDLTKVHEIRRKSDRVLYETSTQE